jgi:hypothetical protein
MNQMNDKILSDFTEATDHFIGALNVFSPEEFNTKRSDGGWSAAQVGEHMNKSHGLGALLRGTTTDTERDPAQFIPNLKDTFLNFENKMQSPEFVVPEDKIYGKEALIRELSEKIADSKMAIHDLDLSLTCTDFVLPQSPPFTRLEWVYFLVFHTMRHTEQLKKLRGDVAG